MAGKPLILGTSLWVSWFNSTIHLLGHWQVIHPISINQSARHIGNLIYLHRVGCFGWITVKTKLLFIQNQTIKLRLLYVQ